MSLRKHWNFQSEAKFKQIITIVTTHSVFLLLIKMILLNFISLWAYLLFTWKTHCGLKFHFGQIDQSEICTKVSFNYPELMGTLIIKLPYSEVKFYTEVKSQTGSSFHFGSHVNVLLGTCLVFTLLLFLSHWG